MMRVLASALVVAALAASAMGVTMTVIAPNGSDTYSEGRSITPDGKYVVGGSGPTAAMATGVLWDATNGTRPIVGTAAATVGTGVGYRTVGGNQQLVVNGTSIYSNVPVSTLWISSDAGASWGQTIRNVSINSTVLVGNANTLGANGTDDTFYTTYASNNTGRVYTIKGSGNPATVATASLTGLSPAASLRSISATGLAAGWRRASTTDTTRCNWKAQDPVTLVSAGYFKGLAGNNYGEAFAVSNDGSKIAGFSPVSDGRIGNWPYIYDVATDAISELPTLGDVGGFATNGVVYGLSADGSYAVGHNFRVVGGVGHESAVLWDVQANQIVDLTVFAAGHGVLGNFTQLGRAYSVGVNDAGSPVVTGTGTYNDNGTTVTRGFVLEIPEPSSMLLLVLGGAALLARRR